MTTNNEEIINCDTDEALSIMFGKHPDLVYIGSNLRIPMMKITVGRQYFTIASDIADINLKNDLTSIAFQKGSNLTAHFDRW